MKEIKKQFFLIHTAGSDEIDYGIIHMSEKELSDLSDEIESEGGEISEFIDEELGIGNFESWIKTECNRANAIKMLTFALEMIKETNTNENYYNILNYCIGIIDKSNDLKEDELRSLVEEVGVIAKNIKNE